MKYFFSVIIPIYNKKKYLNRSIGSVLNQSFNNFELICVNDGSTDQTYEFLKKLKKKKVRILNQDNLGISAAKNIGASISKGKYIAFLDADDKWSKHYLLKMRKLIEKYPNSSAYVSGYRCVNKTQKWNVIFNSKKKDGIVKNYFESRRKNWGVHTSSVIFKRSIFFENKGFPTLIYSQKKNESL